MLRGLLITQIPTLGLSNAVFSCFCAPRQNAYSATDTYGTFIKIYTLRRHIDKSKLGY